VGGCYVVGVGGPIGEVGPAPIGLIDRLDIATSAHWVEAPGPENSRGCGGFGGDSGARLGGSEVGAKRLRPAEDEYASPSDPAALRRWLSDRGCALPASQDGLLEELAHRGVRFAASHVASSVADSSFRNEVPAAGMLVRYASTMRQLESALQPVALSGEPHVVLWAVAPHRQRVAGLPTLSVDPPLLVGDASFGEGYEALLRKRLEAGGGRARWRVALGRGSFRWSIGVARRALPGP
jgi:hypothetical protein